jgi:hypothetical protein
LTIYGSMKDYRDAMRQVNSPSRAHAICRKLTACVNPVWETWPDRQGRSLSAWYGAHYWAACALVRGDDGSIARSKERYRCELTCGDGHRPLPKWFDAMWTLAIKRVMQVIDEAISLKSSNQW